MRGLVILGGFEACLPTESNGKASLTSASPRDIMAVLIKLAMIINMAV
jgi:hypothetical protein